MVCRQRAGNAYLHIYPVGVLQQAGRSPSVKMFDIHLQKKASVDDMVDHYTAYFSIFTEMEMEKVQQLREYFAQRERQGEVALATKLTLAAICWKVNLKC
jgi:hypothetical protein